VINKANNLEVVQEVLDPEDLPAAIERFGPEWVILSLSRHSLDSGRLDTCIANHPCVRFILLSPDNQQIKMKWQTSEEEDLTNLSVRDFIQILEMDLQHT
jgi:hypothetical protein